MSNRPEEDEAYMKKVLLEMLRDEDKDLDFVAPVRPNDYCLLLVKFGDDFYYPRSVPLPFKECKARPGVPEEFLAMAWPQTQNDKHFTGKTLKKLAKSTLDRIERYTFDGTKLTFRVLDRFFFIVQFLPTVSLALNHLKQEMHYFADRFRESDLECATHLEELVQVITTPEHPFLVNNTEETEKLLAVRILFQGRIYVLFYPITQTCRVCNGIPKSEFECPVCKGVKYCSDHCAQVDKGNHRGDCHKYLELRCQTCGNLKLGPKCKKCVIPHCLHEDCTSTFVNKCLNCTSCCRAEFCSRECKADLCRCTHCGKGGSKKLCGGCETERYCSRECQEQAWATHKHNCRTCSHCGKVGRAQRCGGCKRERYCSQECQEQAWFNHRSTCHG